MSASRLSAIPGPRAASRPRRSIGRVAVAWLSAAVALVGAAAAIVDWSRARPGYDPYGWLVWGHQAIHGTLNLGGAPSWKPLPGLFTTPYALAGRSELWLWMVTEVAISLAGAIFAGRAAFWLINRSATPRAQPATTRIAGGLAALVAAAGVLAIHTYEHYMFSAQSDPMLVALCLAALDARLRRHDRTATWLLVLACLGRPEAWPFLVLDVVWAWWRRSSARWSTLAGVLVVGLAWYGVPWLTNGDPNVASALALNTPQALHHHRVTGTIHRFLTLQEVPLWIAAALAALTAIVRRDRRVIAMVLGTVLWVAVEVAFALHGFAPLPRYMFEAGGMAAVLAGVGVGWLVIGLGRPDVPWLRGIGVLCAILLLAGTAGEAVAREHAERRDVAGLRHRADQVRSLGATIDSLGGPRRIRRCGRPSVTVPYASALAYLMRVNVSGIDYKPGRAIGSLRSIVTFRSLPGGGWKVRAWHARAARRAACARLRIAYVPGVGGRLQMLLPRPQAHRPRRGRARHHPAAARHRVRRHRPGHHRTGRPHHRRHRGVRRLRRHHGTSAHHRSIRHRRGLPARRRRGERRRR